MSTSSTVKPEEIPGRSMSMNSNYKNYKKIFSTHFQQFTINQIVSSQNS